MPLEHLGNMPKPVKVFNCLTKEKIGEFPSQIEAAKFLGLHASNVGYIIKHKVKNKTNKLGLTITCR